MALPHRTGQISEMDRIAVRRFVRDVTRDDDETLRDQLDQLFSETTAHIEREGTDVRPVQQVEESFEPGTLCGPFRILRHLDRGGMGGIYLASRSDDLELKVALKIVTHVHAASRALFEKECRILSGLRHPNIAHLIDAGILASGRPWLAMEYVEGETLQTWLTHHRPDEKQRIRLFLKICRAVSYAHCQMIIHRDIKPDNIMVLPDGEPKLLDFGIATTLDPDTGTQMTVNLDGTIAMTPDYASPEQISGMRLGAASDVYSLGVVLYQMLTGRLPYQLRSIRPLEMIRQIRDSHITRPGLVAQEQARMGIHPLSRLGADLDTIILKALAWETGQRYPGVDDLAADLQRYLKGLPVLARPATWRYRMGKFIRRHRWPILVGTGLSLFLILFAAYASQQRIVIARERDRVAQEKQAAEEVSEFMVSMFEGVNPERRQSQAVTVLEVMNQGRRQLDASLIDQVEVRQRLLMSMGRVYRALGNYQLSRDLLLRAVDEANGLASWNVRLELIRTLHLANDYHMAQTVLDGLGQETDHVKDPALLARFRFLLARQMFLLGDYARANDLYREAEANLFALSQQHQTAFRMDRIELFSASGQYDHAIAGLEHLLALNRELYGEQHSELAMSLALLGEQYQNKADYDKALIYFQRAQDMIQALFGAKHPLFIRSQLYLGRLYMEKGEYDLADAVLSQAHQSALEITGEHHLITAACLTASGLLADRQGRGDEAERLHRKALAIKRKALNEYHPAIAGEQLALGKVFLNQGDHANAEKLMRDALKTYAGLPGKDHPSIAQALYGLGKALQEQSNYPAAEPLIRQALEMRIRLFGDVHPEVSDSLHALARFLHISGNTKEAETLFQRSLDMRTELLGEKHPDVAVILNDFALLHYEMGDYLAAESLYRRSLEINTGLMGETHPSVAITLNNLALVLREKGDYVAAEDVFRKSFEINQAVFGKNHHMTSVLKHNMASVRILRGDYETADTLYRESFARATELLGNKHMTVGVMSRNFAVLKAVRGEYVTADALFQQAWTILEALLDGDHERILGWHHAFGNYLLLSGDLNRGERHLSQAWEQALKILPEHHPARAAIQARRARIRRLENDHETAARYLDQAEAVIRDSQNPHHLEDVQHERALLWWQMGRKTTDRALTGRAETLLREVLESRRKALGPSHPKVAAILLDLAELLVEQGSAAEALPLVEEAASIYRNKLPAGHELHDATNSVKGMTLFEMERETQGLALLRKAYSALVKGAGEGHWQTGAARKRLNRAEYR